MDVIEFVKIANRICVSVECGDRIDYCTFRLNNTDFCIEESLDNVSLEALKNAVSIAEDWAKEHPVKTRKSEFLKMFPNARFQKNGECTACPQSFDKTIDCLHTPDCKKCIHDFWNQEV